MKRIYYAALLGLCHLIHLVSPKKKTYKPAEGNFRHDFSGPF